MTKDEALKLALEALESINKMVDYEGNDFRLEVEITALKEALSSPDGEAQPAVALEQEPAAKYIGECHLGSLVQLYDDVKKGAEFYTTPPHSFFEDVSDELRVEIAKLQDHIRLLEKQLAQPEQEPVAWRAWVSKFPQGTGSDWVYVTKPIMKDSIHNQPLYTTPPQRKPLTDEEKLALLKKHFNAVCVPEWFDALLLDIEAAHGIKGEA